MKPARLLRVARAPEGITGDLLWMGIAVFALLVQRVGVGLLPVDGISGGIRRALFVLPALLIFILLARFPRYVGAYVVAIGIVMNLLPMAAHGGLMPVAYDTVMRTGGEDRFTEEDIGKPIEGSKDVLLRREDIHFEWLSDRFVVGLPGPDVLVYSAGDTVELVGLGLVALQAIGIAFFPGIMSQRRDPAEEPASEP